MRNGIWPLTLFSMRNGRNVATLRGFLSTLTVPTNSGSKLEPRLKREGKLDGCTTRRGVLCSLRPLMVPHYAHEAHCIDPTLRVRGVGTTQAQDVDRFHRMFRGFANEAIDREATKSEWKQLPSNERDCINHALMLKGGSIKKLKRAGVHPSDPRLSEIRSGCQSQATPDEAEDDRSPGDRSLYVIDGLVLGAGVNFGSAPYKDYQCTPSDQFAGLTWCERRRQERQGGQAIQISNSLLYGADGETAYISQSINPAFLTERDTTNEIARLSARFIQAPRIQKMPARLGFPKGIIASWGQVELIQIDESARSILAAGESPRIGLLIDFLGDSRKSVKAGLPVFRLAGGPGYVWSASFELKKVGHLRFLAIDAAALTDSHHQWTAEENASESSEAEVSLDTGEAPSQQADEPGPAAGPGRADAQQDLEAAKREVEAAKQQAEAAKREAQLAKAEAEAAKQQINKVGLNASQLQALVAVLGFALLAVLFALVTGSLRRRGPAASPAINAVLPSLSATQAEATPNVDEGAPRLSTTLEIQPESEWTSELDLESEAAESFLEEGDAVKKSSQPRYATAECYDCHIRLPKPQMHKSSISRYSPPGTRAAYFRKGRGGYYSQSGYSLGTGRTTTKEIWLCENCFSQRKAYQFLRWECLHRWGGWHS